MNAGTCIRSPLALAKPRAPLRAWKRPNFTNFVSCLQLAALAGDLPSPSIEQERESIEATASALGEVKTFATSILGAMCPQLGQPALTTTSPAEERRCARAALPSHHVSGFALSMLSVSLVHSHFVQASELLLSSLFLSFLHADFSH